MLVVVMCGDLISRLRRHFPSKGKDAAGWIRTILSPAVAFLLLSAITRAGWVSIQILYSRQTVTVTFLGPSLDTWLWISLTVALGVVAAADVWREPNRSVAATFISGALVVSVFVFAVAAASGVSILAIAVGVLIYFIDLAGTVSPRILGWSSVGVKILGFFGPLTCAFVLTVVGELTYPMSVRSSAPQLPWLLSEATQLAIAAYHGLDLVVPLLYAVLLLLPFGLLLMRVLRLDRKLLGDFERSPDGLSSSTVLAVAVTLCALTSALLFLPYVTAGRPVGVDFGWYIDKVSELSQGETIPTLASSHPLILLIALTFKELFQVSPELAVQLTTEAVAISAAASAGWFTIQATKDRTTALLAVLFSLFSIRATAGYFAGVLANWFAMAEMFVALGLLLKFLQDRRIGNLLLALAVNAAAFVTHVETWIILSLLMLLIGLRRREAVLGTGVVVLTLALLSIGNVEFLTSQFDQMSQVVGTFSLQNPTTFLTNLEVLSQFFMIGLFKDPVLLILSILGLIYASAVFVSSDAKHLILAWSVLAGLFVLFFSPEFAWRMLYQVPYEVLAALGAYVIWRACQTLGSKSQMWASLAATVLLAICLATIANGIRAVLVPVVP
jgi:hypothetical protein